MDKFLEPPYPKPGGKRYAVPVVWKRFGPVYTYVEPFHGSLVMLLNSPYGPAPREIVSDINGFEDNTWRSIKFEPHETAFWADYPTSHISKIARREYLRSRYGELVPRLVKSLEYCEPKTAGLWLLETAESMDMSAKILERAYAGTGEPTTHVLELPWEKNYPLPPHIVDGASGRGISIQKRTIPMPKWYLPTGVRLQPWLTELGNRLARVNLVCQSWDVILNNSSVMSESLRKKSVTGFFLDPPYPSTGDAKVYINDDRTTAGKVFNWSIKWGDEPNYRIALCGYEDDYGSFPDGWTFEYWKRGAGLENIGRTTRDKNRQEVIWFSPYCYKDGDAPPMPMNIDFDGLSETEETVQLGLF